MARAGPVEAFAEREREMKPNKLHTLRASLCTAALTVSLVAAPAQARDAISIGLIQEPPGLDPTIRTAAIINYISMMNIFEGLTKLNEDGTYSPNLAKSWEVTPDGKTYTFHLLEGVRFSDGSDLTAEDVKWTFERNASPESTNNNKKYFELMERIETPDPYTVVVHLKEPSSMLLHRLAWGGSSIVDPASAETNVTNPVGTGAFMLDNWVKGGAIKLKRNPHYRDPSRVSLNSVTFTVIQDPAAQVSALLAGDIDVFPQFHAPESVPLLEANPDFDVHKGASEAEVVVGINNKKPPFDDVRVRRALLRAIDRDSVMQAAHFGFGTPIGSPFSINHPASIDLVAENDYDPEAARRLLAEAGHENGFATVVKLPDLIWTHRAAEVIQADLRKVGIDMQIEKYQWAQWLEVVFRNRDYDLCIISHVDPMDIANYSIGNYFYQYDSPAFQQIWRNVELSTSEADQRKWLEAAQRKLAEDVPVAFLYQTTHLTVARKGLNGIWKSLPHYIADMTTVHWSE